MKATKVKKIAALLLSALTVFSTLPAWMSSASAIDIEGDWTVYRNPNDYREGEGDEFIPYTPAPGYEYTEEGFKTVSADYTNCTPFFTVQSKEPQSLKDGIYLETRIDQFTYGGELGSTDHWICLSIWDTANLAPGATAHGSGFWSLQRTPGNGESGIAETLITTGDTEDVPGTNQPIGGFPVTPTVDENGLEHYILTVEWVDNSYVIKVNGSENLATPAVTEKLESLNADGQFYIGISMFAAGTDGVADLTILKYGTSEESALVPKGSDSKAPDENVNAFGDPADPTKIPKNEPALLWDATGSTYYGEANGSNMKLTPQGDNSFHVQPTSSAPYITWSVKNPITYKTDDFPCFAMLLHNCPADTGSLMYCGGDVMGFSHDSEAAWTLYDEHNLSYNDDEYVLVVVDLLYMWEGRINGLRPVFQMEVTPDSDPADIEFDVMWMGMFRSVDEAHAYANARMNVNPAVTDSTTAPAGTTEAPAVTTTPVETTAQVETTAPAATVPESTAAPAASETTAPEKGCKSVIFLPAGLILLSCASTCLLLKKKH